MLTYYIGFIAGSLKKNLKTFMSKFIVFADSKSNERLLLVRLIDGVPIGLKMDKLSNGPKGEWSSGAMEYHSRTPEFFSSAHV